MFRAEADIFIHAEDSDLNFFSNKDFKFDLSRLFAPKGPTV
jgi:hypothetical protein